MEITDVEPILLSYPLSGDEQWKLGGGYKQSPIRGVKSDLAIVRVHTDEGLTGLGEPTPYAGAENVRDDVERLRPALVGEDPFDVNLLEVPTDTSLRADRYRFVMAAVDMACWDIMGKATGRPVAQLLGGIQADEIPVYASGGIDWRYVEDPDVLIEEAEGYLDEGYEAFKFRIAPDDRFLDAVEALHDAVGEEMDLIVEGNARFQTAPDAVRAAQRFAAVDPLWFEEPVDTTNLEAYRDIRRALPGMRISGGESKETADEFAPWVENRAYDVVQPDCNVTGITEARRIAELAGREGLPCVPHNWHNAITTAANLHLAAAVPNHYMIEQQRTCHFSCEPFRSEIVEDPIAVEDGVLRLPDEPGLGVSLDMDAVERYPFEPGPVLTEWEDHPF